MEIASFLFSSWQSVARILIVGAPIYVALLLVLQVVGKHALAKSNAYGMVVTTALGSTLASAVLTKQVALVDGVLAIGLLLGLQYLVSTLVTKYDWASRWFTAKPSLVLWEGRILYDELQKDRLTVSNLLSAVRQSGFSSVEDVGAVVLEVNGSLSVIADLKGTRSALADLPWSRAIGASEPGETPALSSPARVP